jgi:cytidine deaminase
VRFIPDQSRLLASLPDGHPAISHASRLALLGAARAAARNAHAPYSSFHVGAALRTKAGKIYQGNNTETGSYEGLTCGERGAIMDAITHGEALAGRKFIEMLAVSCIRTPSPYAPLMLSEEGRRIANVIEKKLPSMERENFASLTPGWLEQDSVINALSDGSPCGACRQFANEFSDKDTIILIDDQRDGVLFRMSDLLPVGFYFGDSATPPKIVQAHDVDALEARAGIATSPSGLADIAATIAENLYGGLGFRRNGAAIVMPDGRAVCGASAVNSSTGLSINALRTAVTRAAQKGLIKEFGNAMIARVAISFIDAPEEGRRDFAHALQTDIFQEFGNDQTEIIVQDAKGRIATTSLKDVLGPVRGIHHSGCCHS